VLLVHATTQPMRFLGTWAPFSRTTLENFRTGRQLGDETKGPATPTLQPLWQKPLKTIFGGGTWHEECAGSESASPQTSARQQRAGAPAGAYEARHRGLALPARLDRLGEQLHGVQQR
jgi:hypothetical protein